MSATELKILTDKIDGLQRLLFAPGYATAGHSPREEVIYSQDKVLVPAIGKAEAAGNAATAGTNRLLYGGGRNDGSDRPADLARQVQDVQNRVLQVGGRWDNFQDIVMRLNLILEALKVPVPGGPVPVVAVTYTVKAGDTLSGIATATGKSVADLVAWNKLASADAIEVGQVLRLGP